MASGGADRTYPLRWQSVPASPTERYPEQRPDQRGDVMDSFALYYPYIHVRDDSWLKYTALYWPNMRRLRPTGYPVNDSPAARILNEDLGWLIDMNPPQWATATIGQPLLELLAAHAPALRDRFGVDRVEHWRVREGLNSHAAGVGWLAVDAAGPDARLDDRFGYVHVSKIDSRTLDAVVDAGLATTAPGQGGTWVGMHPELASVYTCALIEHIAVGNRMHPVTDQVMPHSALSGWSVDRLAQVLIGEPLAEIDTQHSSVDPVDAFVLMAFETVVPADLAAVPIEKIIEVRAKFGQDLDNFRRYVAEQAQQLAALEGIRDWAVVQDYLRDEVQRKITVQLKQLRERLRSVGLEPVRALANVKSVTLPPLAAMVADTVGMSPVISGSTALAATVVSTPTRWRNKRKTTIEESPVGYLFRIEQTLNPTTLIDRLRRSWPRR